jgi:cell division protein FtsA
MIKNISVGVDIGTSMTRVVVGEFVKGSKSPKVIGIGEAPTYGLRHGYVINTTDAIDSLKKAVSLAETSAGTRIKRAVISISPSTLRGETTTGSTIISKADNEVTALDIQKALGECEDSLNLNNKKIIHAFPVSYKLDGKEIFGRIEGLHGTKLEVKTLFVTCGSQHFEDLIEVVTKAGINPIEVVASPIPGSTVTLAKRQRIVGGAVVDIGYETMSVGVFENENLISLHSFPIGGSDITNDIALGLKITLDDAERLKLERSLDTKKEEKQLGEIIEARLGDMFDLIDGHLKKIKRSGLLPAGIIFIGGGANIENLEELAKEALKLPVKIGTTEMFGNVKTKLRNPAWFEALGLIGYTRENEFYQNDSIPGVFKDIKNSIKSITRQLLP